MPKIPGKADSYAVKNRLPILLTEHWFLNKVPVGCRSSKECKNQASCIEGKCAKVDAFARRTPKKIAKMKKKGKKGL